MAQIDISGFIMPATDTYTFSLYDGFDISGSLLASNTTGVFTDLAGGFYTIIATSLTSECVTPPVTITVPDLQDRPSIVGTPSDNTNCASPFSGQISITASSSFSEPTSYTYNVYDGPNTTPANLLQTFSVADGSVATVATGLDDGTYRIEVINDDILCSNFIDVVVGETTTDPTFVASASDNVSCGGATGSVSITSVSGTNILSVTDHSYTWYLGQVVDAGSLLGETSSSLSGVGQNYYTVVVTNDNTGCESDPQTFYVDDVPYDPIITVGQIEDTSCATFPADGTGQLGAYATQTDQPGSIFGDEDGYTFEWYEGNGTGGTLISSSDTTTATIAAGTYTLVVTGGASCSATTVVVLNNNPITPVVTGGTVNDNDICDATFLNGSNGGDITVDVTFDGTAVTVFTGYTFTWYEGNGTGGTQIVGDATPSPNGSEPVITGNNISGLLADQYTVVVTSPNSCESASAVFEVDDAVILPSISTTVDANLSSCDALAPNGAASALVGGTATGYDFVWFVGNGTTTPISAPATAGGTNNSEATGLAAGTYTVRATDQATGCQSTQTVSITTVLATVSITGSSVTDDDQCTGGNGAITISEVQVVDNGVTSTYSTDADINANVTLELYSSDGTTLLGSFTAPDTTGLPDGSYVVIVTDNNSTCTSANIPFVIDDIQVNPTLSASEASPSSICVGGTSPDGSATVSITNDDGGAYTYQWYTGSTVNPANLIGGATASLLTGVEAGDYTVLVTDDDGTGNGCTAVATTTVTENPATITINASTNTGASNCASLDNGSFEITEVHEDGANVAAVGAYEYEFFDDGANSIQGPSTTAIITGLTPGDYTVVITRTTSNCASDPISFTIDDESATPTVGLTPTDNTDCSGAAVNGSVLADVTLGAGETEADYSFTWYVSATADVGDAGSSTQLNDNDTYNGFNVSISDNGGFTGNLLEDLPANIAGETFWVRVTDNTDPSSTCYTDVDAIIEDDPADIVVTFFGDTESDQCTPHNGTVEVTAITINGAPTNSAAGFEALETAGYTFDVLQSDASTVLKAFNISADGGTNTFPGADALSPGTYYIRITSDLGCVSALQQFEIDDDSVNPTLSASEASPSSVCAGGTGPDGSATVLITNDDGGAYTYQWYTGTTVNPANLIGGATANLLTGVEAGDYTVLVTDDAGTGDGCTAVATTTVTVDPATITINASTNTGASNCASLDNGSFEITEVHEDGANVAAVGDYTYQFFDNGGSPVASVGGTASNLTPGDYTVVITRTTSNCASDPISFTIDDESATPTVGLTPTDNTDCSGATVNGSILADVTLGAGENEADYSFTWYVSATADVGDAGSSTQLNDNDTYNGFNVSISDNGGFTGNLLEDLPANTAGETFWVRVTDNTDPSSTCFTDADQIIIDDPADIVVVTANPTDSDQCTPQDGEIEITEITINGATTNTAAGFEALETAGYAFDVLQSDQSTVLKAFNINADGGTNTFPGADALVPGTYYIRITNDLSCISALYQFDIDDARPVPTTNTVSGTDNPVCSGIPDGSVTSTFVWTGGAVNYQWYYGTIASGAGVALVEAANPGNGSIPSDPTAATVTGLAGGTYYVEITDADGGAGTGCVYRQEITILNDAAVVVAAGSKDQDNTGCIAANYDGSYTVTSATTDGLGTFPDDYNFEWYTSGGTNFETTDGAIAGGETNADLGAGSYYVIVVDKATNCSSASLPFTIANNLTIPAITASTVTNVERCDDTIDNGEIDIDVDGFADPGAAYSIQWYSGGVSTIGAGTLLSGQTDDVLSNLDIGTYSVRVTIAATGCSLDQAFVVGSDVPTEPSFTIAVTTEPDVCNPGNGVLTASGFAGAATDYTWTWLLDDRTTDISTTGAVVANEVVTSVSEGDYYAVIEDISTGCVSDTVPVTIDRDASAVFTIVETITQAPGDCSEAVGSFTIDISDGSGTTSVDVSITDDFGNTITANGVTINGGAPEITVAAADPLDGSTFIHHEAATNGVLDFINGGYFVEVTNSNITTCDGDMEFFLPFDEAPRLDLATPVVTSHSYNCNSYDGSAISAGDNTDGMTGGQGGATGEVSVTLTLIDGADPAIDDNHHNYQIFLYQGTDPLPSPDTDIEVTLDNASGLAVMDFVTVGGGASTAQVTAISGNDVTLEFEDGDITDFTTSGNFLDGGEQVTAVQKDGLWSVSTGRATDIQVAEGILVAVATDEGVGSSGFNGGVNDYQRTYTFSGLTAGEYTILAAQEGKAFCLSPSVTFEVEDRFDEFYIDAASAVYVDIDDNDDCSGADADATGAIDILRIDRILEDISGADSTATGTDVSDFTFAWYQGSAVNASLEIPADVLGTAVVSNGGATLTGLPSGSYTVRITGNHGDGVSGNECANTYTFVVDDNPDDISIDLGGTTPTAAANTNCDSPFDGSIDMNNVDIEITDRDGNTTTQQWPITDWEAYLYESGTGLLAFNGTDNTQAADINYLDDGTTTGTDFTQLEDGDYIIVLFDDSGCEATAYSITVGDGKTNPALSDGTADTNNTNCTTDPNGQITVELAGDPADYDIQWYIGGIGSTTAFVDGTDGDVATAGVSPATLSISNIIGGTYTVRVEDNTNSVGCVSFYTTSISDNVDAIIAFSFAETDVTDCTPDNGTVTLTGVNLFNTSTNTSTSLSAGDETAMDEYTITVYETDGMTVVDTDVEDAGDNLTISDLSPGDYLIELSHPATSCFSSQRAFTIEDDASNPTLTLVQTAANTICDPTAGVLDADGTLTLTVATGDLDGNYDVQWYAGATGNTGTSLADGGTLNNSDISITPATSVDGAQQSVITGLIAGTYWVQVTDNTSNNLGCSVSAEITLTSDFTDITLDVPNVTVNDATDCTSPDNGSISIDFADISGSGAAITDYTLSITGINDNTDDNAALALSTDPEVISDLHPDTYNIVITDETTGCVSQNYQVVVGQDGTMPVLSATVTDDNFCNGGNGTITIDVTAPDTDENNYTFNWFQGTNNTNPFTTAEGSPADGAVAGANAATDLDAGFYTVVVTALASAADGTGCSTSITVQVEDDPYAVAITATPTDVTDCTPDNGTITVNSISITSDEDGTSAEALADAEVTYEIFSDEELTASVSSTTGDIATSFSALAPGTYYLTATYSGASIVAPGCSSPAVQLLIADDADNPTLTLVQTAPNTICNPTAGVLDADGALTLTVATGDLDGNYDVQWYYGASGDTSTPLADGGTENNSDISITPATLVDGAQQSVITGLIAGTYWVQVGDNTSNNLGCTASAEITLTSDFTDITLDVPNVTVNDATDCTSPDNGSISIDFADISGSGAAITDYTLSITGINDNTDDNAALALSTDPEVISDLHPDTYNIVITDETTGCVSQNYQVVVGQDGTMPVLSATVTDDNFCSGGNGTITIDVTAPDTDENNYTFNWFQGTNNTNAFTTAEGSPADGAVAGANAATDLEAGFYTVVVTALGTAADGTGCSTSITVQVEDDPYAVAITATPTDVTDCTPDNGTITINSISITSDEDGTSAQVLADAEVTYEIFSDEELTASVASTTGDAATSFSALAPGTYYLTATYSGASAAAPGCSSPAVQLVIADDATAPVVVITELQANTYCSGAAAADGQLQAQVDEGGPLVTAGYSFQWYKGSLGDMSDPRDATAMTTADLEDGNYWVRVTDTDGADDNLGCSTDATFVLSHDPTETTVAIASATNDTRCDSDNGTITVSEVSFTRLGATTTANTTVAIDADYTLEYFNESLVSQGTFTAAAGVSNLAAGTYYVTATHDTYECASATFEVEVLEDVAFPDLVGTPTIVNNTSCDIAAANGSITFEVETAGAFSGAYTFTLSPAVPYAGVGSAADPVVISALDNGTYTVIVEDNANGCSSEFEFQVLDEQVYPSISLDDNSVTDVTTCLAANGSITINASDIEGSSTDITDYTIDVLDGASGVVYSGTPGADPLVLSNLGADTYTVSVTDNTNTCASGSIEVSIVDASVDPVLAVTSMTPNDECTDGLRTVGAISITADGQTEVDGNHTFLWHIGTGTGSTVSSVYGTVVDTEATLTGVPDGQYTVVVSNISGGTNNGCQTTQTFTITNDPVSPIITSFEANNNLDCVSPGGSGSLVAATLDGMVLDSATLAAEYTIGWFSDAALTVAVADTDPLVSPLELNGLAAGEYYAVITRDLTGCSSTAYQFTIVDNPSLPEIEIEVVQADSTCSATVGTGILVAKADGQTDANTNYTFNWYDDSSNLLASNDTLSDLLAGTYTIEVTHVNTGCVDTESITLGNAPQEPEILTVSVTDPTNCEPGNGVIEVTDVSIATTDRYTFAFFDDNPLSGATAFQDGSSTSFSAGLPDMTYYIVGTDTLTGCTTGVYQVQLSADDIVYPEIQLVSALSNRQCDPALADGEMTLAIYTTVDDVRSQVDPADYTITWSDSNGNAISTTVDAAQMTISAEGLEAGSYTIVATNNATGCTTVDIVRLADDRPPFVLLPSSAPNLNCDNPNGSVNVRVQQVGTFVRDAEFFWFIGDVENPDINNPDYTGVDPDGLEQGIYTVIARGTEDPSCISERATVEVEDGTVPPDYTVVVDNHVTICYEDQPNGLARIDTAASDVSAYEFMWYEGADTTGTQIQTGLSADSLSIGTYTVLARDRNTGCVALQNVEIIDDTPVIADPTIVVVSGRTNCLFPNGVAVANTGGLTDGFRFEWYAADNPDSLLFVGNEIQTLDADTYEVLAIDIASGCVSGRTTTTIPYSVEDPEFSIVTTGSLCLRTEDGSANQFSGQAFVAIETLGVYVDSVTYFDNAGDIVLAARGAETLIDATPGAYTVNFRASNGCDYSSTFVIDSEIRIYNGVSANDDGMNDFFLIDCLDFFENNNVQIFTRDGIRIYEIDGYDNITKRFNGTSNVGATQDLPAGTYFYVIDKGDGSDLIQGFLELVR